MAVAVVTGSGVRAPDVALGKPCSDRVVDRAGNAVEVACNGSDSRPPSPPSPVRFDPSSLVVVLSAVDGQMCRILASPGSAQGQAAIAEEQNLLTTPQVGGHLLDVWHTALDGLAPCPAGAAPLDPTGLAYAFAHQMSPPSTNPTIAPGHAICGKPAYLQQDVGPATQTFDTILGPLTITLRPTTFTVDWGDRTTTDPGPFPTPGGAWPDGPATHTYTRAGTYTVTLTQTWEADWTVADHHNTSPLTVTSTDTIDNFQARQLQAVRNR